ncbi:G-patch domain containing protein [Parasponia andersonii]|uniref:G-patch domain containing protein n=1 Tax=Parasponia andersonii TaxID=3476 RepID=A0A2P5CLZ8_PARAD|nr:G-patch domain containing protein [Parasponia andersonii]
MDSDEEDYVFYGTPIEREEEVTSRKKKAVAEASGQLRTLPSWKQEVRDEEGRRRFHGAFTGGYSAGYFNTVGSKEGWTPQTFVSSRKNRAEVKQQSIFSFLDEDEKSELAGQSLGTSSQFDTFGFTAAEIARGQAEKEQQKRPSAIPGPVPDEIVLPATESIGVKLLLKMGWRRGRSIKDSHANSVYDVKREARKAFLAFSSDDAKAQAADSESIQGDLENYIEQPASDEVISSQGTCVYGLTPKQDLHGLGFDPYKNAPEFRERKRSRISDNRDPEYGKALSVKNSLFGFKSGKVAPGFGIGALEELDAEDEDVFASDYDFEETYVQEIDEPSTKSMVDNKRKLIKNERGVLLGFRLASNADYQPERFDPPLVPKDFVPCHKFAGPLETDHKVPDAGPPEVSPPEDNNLKLLIDGVATLVARCGKLFEDISREKNQSNPLFSFLLGGNGHDYYVRKLWEARQKRADQKKHQLDGKASPSLPKLTAESRGKILGERPLERSSNDANPSVASSDSIHLQYNLSDTFTKPASFSELPEVVKPFKEDPAKQERFERFLKEKYQGGLRTTQFSGAVNLSEAARARERLDFEAAAEAIEKGTRGKETKTSTQHIAEFLTTGGMRFTSGGLEKAEDTHADISKEMYPKRGEYQWHPSPMLCKRFDLIDPYMGKPPPAPRMRSKIDTLIFTPDSVTAKNVEETTADNRDSFAIPQIDAQGISKDVSDKEIEVEVAVENVERPVDLYKAIFSDDSDEEEDAIPIVNKVEYPEKKVEAANTALNRLMAGDFLESLGKELGLELPPDPPYSTNKARPSASQKVVNENPGNDNVLHVEAKPPLTTNVSSECPINPAVLHDKEMAQDGRQKKNEPIDGDSAKSRVAEIVSSKNNNDQVNPEKIHQEDRKVKTRRRSSSTTSSSEDERSRRLSRRHRHRSSDSDSDSSSDHRHRSRSRGRRKESSREKSRSSRKHSKHHGHRSRVSPIRSHYGSEKEGLESKREKHRRRS